jgi:hypothetical protein
LNLAQVPHSLSPQFLEALRQIVRELTVTYKERREPTFLHEWMVQRQHDGVIVHHVKRVTESPPNSGRRSPVANRIYVP